VLLLLDEQPRHGYEILTELADRSDGQWQPSPGSVYPVLKRLAKDGLVKPMHEEGRRVFSLTDEGVALVAAEREAWGEPWAQATAPEADAATELWAEGKQLGAAVWQVGQLNDPTQIAAAVEILADARKRIYGLLAH
jgi:DNA-binding PadR family transcriptional regulator